jgi:hypothetical protein
MRSDSPTASQANSSVSMVGDRPELAATRSRPHVKAPVSSTHTNGAVKKNMKKIHDFESSRDFFSDRPGFFVSPRITVPGFYSQQIISVSGYFTAGNGP